MDNDETSEVVLTEGSSDKIRIIEASSVDKYSMYEIDMPASGKTSSNHGIDLGDVDGDERDEAFIANVEGSIWVVTNPNVDVSNYTTDDIYRIADTGEQWAEAKLGDLGNGKMSFVIAAGNASKIVAYEYQGGDVTESTSYDSIVVVDSSEIDIVIDIYSLDLPGDMDDDGLQEILFARGSTRGGFDAPALFVKEGDNLPYTITDGLPNSIISIEDIKGGIDLDKDNKQEFILAVYWPDSQIEQNRHSLYVFENDGDDTYNKVWSYDFPGGARQFMRVDVSDLDSDGHKEVLAVREKQFIGPYTYYEPNLYVFEYKDEGYKTITKDSTIIETTIDTIGVDPNNWRTELKIKIPNNFFELNPDSTIRIELGYNDEILH